MRDLAKTGKLNLRLVPPKDDVRGAKTKFLVTGISGW
jgi:hypothetical protein